MEKTRIKKPLALLLSLLVVLTCFSVSFVGVSALNETEGCRVNSANGDDNNDGTDSAHAFRTIDKAIEQANARGITDIRIFLDSDYTFGSDMDFPSASEGSSIRIHGSREGIKLFIGGKLRFSNDIAFDSVCFVPTCNDTALVMQYNSLIISPSVTSALSGKASEYPSIIGGYYVKNNPPKLSSSMANPNYDASLTADSVSCLDDALTVENTINGGVWNTYLGGNYREATHSPIGICNADIITIIDGAAFVSDGKAPADRQADVVAAGGMNIQKGDVTLNINGGTFGCSVYGIPRRGIYRNYNGTNGAVTDGALGECRYTSNITVTIGSGDFTSANCYEIGALQSPNEVFDNGNFTFEVKGGTIGPDVEFSAKGMSYASATIGASYSGNTVIDFDKLNGKDTGDTKALRVMCIGDSITEGTGSLAVTDGNGYTWGETNFNYPSCLQKSFDAAGKEVIVGNFGYSGSVAYAGLNNDYIISGSYNLSTEFKPDIIIIAIGTNQAGGIALAESKRNALRTGLRTLIESYHTRFENAEIYLTSALPRSDNATYEANNVMYTIPIQKQIAAEYSYTHLIDLYKPMSDYATKTYFPGSGLHPSNTGYSIMAGFIFDYFEDSVTAEFAAGKTEADITSVLLNGTELAMNRVMVDENKIVLRRKQITSADSFNGTLQVLVDAGKGVADTNNVYILNKRAGEKMTIKKRGPLSDVPLPGEPPIRVTAPAGLRTTVFGSALTLSRGDGNACAQHIGLQHRQKA